MINPSELCLDSLPSLPLDSLAQLPPVPCIYFAIDDQGVIQYIGRSSNLKNRWRQHHRRSQLDSARGVRIAYLLVDVDLLADVEAALIQFFSPKLNGKRVEGSSSSSADSNHRSKPLKYGETKTPWQILLTPAASLMLDTLAIEYGATRSDFVEQLIRGLSACDEETRDRLIAPVSAVKAGDR